MTCGRPPPRRGGPAYNGSILNNPAGRNPLSNRQGFVDNSGGAIHTSLTKAIAPGSTVQIRFRVGTDSGTGAGGWDIDNISFNGVVETPFSTLVAETGVCPLPGPVQLQLTPGALPDGTINSPYTTTTLAPSGGSGPYSFNITPFALPQGLNYDIVNGELQISGTPLRAGTFPVTVLVGDGAGHQRSFNYTITINKLVKSVTWNNPADITYGTALGAGQLDASAGVPGTFTYTPAAFFLSIEFQNTGYLVYRANVAAFGPTRVGNTVPLTFGEFLPDVQRLGQGFAVGAAGWKAKLEANKQAYFKEFVARPAFTTAYPSSLTPAQFVDTLNTNAGGALSQSERDALVAELTANNSADGRASALRQVADDADLKAAHLDKAFVLMQYFGYLRRDPNAAPDTDFAGYLFWLGKLNQFDGDYVKAEMVKAFMNSDEYRHRLGQ